MRLADLLARYDLPATFYTPRASQRPTMSEDQLRALATRFELGGHTLDHLDLTTLPDADAKNQIEGCKRWLEDVTARPCPAFCPPLGHFNPQHLAMIRDAGFRSARTVELLSLDRPRPSIDGFVVLPTALQAYPHRRAAYVRNALRRRSITNLWRAATLTTRSWVDTLRSLIERAAQHGGVVHLWGHSWEIEETNQWPTVEEALRLLRDCSTPTTRVTNSELLVTPAA